MARVALEGLAEVRGRLDALKRGLRNKILRPAVRKAAVPVKAAMKQVAAGMGYPVIAAAVDLRTATRRGEVFARVGVFGQSAKGQAAYYAHWIDLGVRPHALGKGSRLRKKQQSGRMHPGFKGKHFRDAAWQASKGHAEQAVAAALAENIAKVLG